MSKIKHVSLIFRYSLQLIFILMPLLLAIFWINAPHPLARIAPHSSFFLSYIPGGLNILYPLSAQTKILGFAVSLIPLSINLIIIYLLISLFKQFSNNEIFTINNVRTIKRIGYALLIGQLLSPIHQALLSAVLTWSNPPGMRTISVSFVGTNIGIILTAVLLILISWIFAQGAEIQEEQQYTV